MKKNNSIKTYLNAHIAHLDVSLYETTNKMRFELDDDVRRFNDELKRFTQTRRKERALKNALRVC